MNVTGPVLDSDALRVFADKGAKEGLQVSSQRNANAAKVRRIMQLTQDLAGKPFGELRILDMACGEGVYAIEAGLRGADVLAIDGRTERMAMGAEIAKRHGLDQVRFEQQDIRMATRAVHGTFDVIYFLGILYHLDVPDAFTVLENIHDMVKRVVVIDTHVTLNPDTHCEHRGHRYAGTKAREHGDNDSGAERRAHVLMSLDNTFAFQFSRSALIRLLVDLGFTSVMEIHAPLEPVKLAHRITLVAMKGERAAVSSYPWINGLTEDEISSALAAAQPGPVAATPKDRRSGMSSAINGILGRTLGVELRRARRARSP